MKVDIFSASIITALLLIIFSGPISRVLRNFDPEYESLQKTQLEYQGYRQGVLDANQ